MIRIQKKLKNFGAGASLLSVPLVWTRICRYGIRFFWHWTPLGFGILFVGRYLAVDRSWNELVSVLLASFQLRKELPFGRWLLGLLRLNFSTLDGTWTWIGIGN
uniref:Uncharacterized protein n=1 Tax=Rhizophagus irregularis (strain DAOM 181602 / DAOM 197198 / MUCL 43194) TaxID=747089 RepID=U9TX42_RHIID